VTFNATFLALARHWGFRPRACAPYRARTKGKTESGVGYVKKNAIAGRSFPSWEAFEAHLRNGSVTSRTCASTARRRRRQSFASRARRTG
jgi:transposase